MRFASLMRPSGDRPWRSLLSILCVCVLWQTLGVSQSWAQSEKPRPAVIAFHADPARILDSDLAKALNIRASFRYDPMSEQLWKATSVKGIVSLPEDIRPFIEMQPRNPMPFHYYIEFELKNDQHVQDLKQELSKRIPEQEERDGGTYYYPQYEAGAYVAVTKERRAIMASESYEYNSRRFPAMTETAERLLKETQKDSAGLAVDLKGAERFVRSGVEFGEENLPPFAKPYLTLPEKIVWLRGGFALVPNPEIRAVIDCANRDDAEEIQETIRGLIGLGKLNLNGTDPSVEMNKKFLDAIKSQVEGRQVVLTALIPTDLLTKMREAAAEAQGMNEVKQALLGVHNYHDVYGRFPFNPGPNESKSLSWRVRMLPYCEESALHSEFDLSQAWDSPVNRPLLDRMPRLYGEGNQTGLRWIESDVNGFQDLTDGSSNTIAFVYNAPPVSWTENKPLTHNEVVRMFLALQPGEHMIVGMYDGSVRRISADTNVETFEAMLTPNGGEVIEADR